MEEATGVGETPVARRLRPPALRLCSGHAADSEGRVSGCVEAQCAIEAERFFVRLRRTQNDNHGHCFNNRLVFLEALEELDLPGVVHVVVGNAQDEVKRRGLHAAGAAPQLDGG